VEWTQPDDLTAQLVRHWDQGRLFASIVGQHDPFPLRLRLRCPDTRSLGSRFEEVRFWIRKLEESSRDRRGFGYEIEWVEFNHRQLGRNRVPHRINVPTELDALKLIGKEKEAARFRALFHGTIDTIPDLKEWVVDHPFAVLGRAAEWQKVLSVVTWLRNNPTSNLYIRQIDISGIDTKFIEERKPLLNELLEALAIKGEVPSNRSAPRTFEQRYGLRAKPATIRFRILDHRRTIEGLSDISVPDEEFASLRLPVSRIFITENEVNGLTFPAYSDSVVVFGLGYSVDRLAAATWMENRSIHYWGDIDTHGFAILDRLRAVFPKSHSLLMDRHTLTSHQSLWVRERSPHPGPLSRLEAEELALFQELVENRHGTSIRLEQERIPFSWVQKALMALSSI
jgi:hypothetical protein